MEVVRSEKFSQWLSKLRDRQAAARIEVRIDRLKLGNFGVVNHVGDGVSEFKFDFGPGYRVYFFAHGDILVVLLCGGDKSTQPTDIATALAMAKDWKETLKKEQKNETP